MKLKHGKEGLLPYYQSVRQTIQGLDTLITNMLTAGATATVAILVGPLAVFKKGEDVYWPIVFPITLFAICAAGYLYTAVALYANLLRRAVAVGKEIEQDLFDCGEDGVEEELERLPAGVNYAPQPNRIGYESRTKRLIFRGSMSESEKKELLSTTWTDQYKKALEALFEKSNRKLLTTYLDVNPLAGGKAGAKFYLVLVLTLYIVTAGISGIYLYNMLVACPVSVAVFVKIVPSQCRQC